MRKSVLAFPGVDQVYTISAAGINGNDDCQLATPLGTLTGYSGGTVTGGDGKDPDGVTVALSLVHALHLRNTGEEDIYVEPANPGPGGNQSVSALIIPAGGEGFTRFPAGWM